jgi:phosphomannomutase
VKDWQSLAAQLRVDSIRCTTEAGSGHPTSCLSAADLMAVLLAKYLKYDWANPRHPNNDRLIFSKGHACPLLYAMFKAAGVITDGELLSLRKFGSRLQGHPNPRVLPYVDVATGSLGQGLPIGVGMALNGKYLDKLPYRTWVLLGDSEMAEGSIWEAFDKASFRANRGRPGGAGSGDYRAGAARATLSLRTFLVVADPRRIAVLSRRRGHAPRAGVHRRRGAVGARWQRLFRRSRRRSALAGGGRRVFLPASQCSHFVGSRVAGIVPACGRTGVMTRAENEETATMKKLVVFDLDGTLAESKSPLDVEMSALLSHLFGIVKVAVISGGSWPQFQKQVLSNLSSEERLKNLSLLPTCGTQFYKYEGGWKKLYAEDFTTEEKEKIISSLKKAIGLSGFKAEKVWGELIEDRGSQITYSALGQQAPLEEKKKWGPDFAKRKKIKAILDGFLPEFSVRLGGSTSIDVTKPGIDKAYGIRKLRDILGITIEEMMFIGDALFPGGNDYPAKEAGVVSIQVSDPNET